jgi:signal-transduction protein with cAMP-binding, CBS, and nucleotidyltransferase domain
VTRAVSSGHVLSIARTPLGELALRPPVRVAPEDSLEAVAQLMRHEGVSSVLVGPDPAAFATERDLVHALAEGLGPQQTIGDVATACPLWVPASMQLGEAAASMVQHDMRHLLVMDYRGTVIGVLSMRSALRMLLQEVEPASWQLFFWVGAP